MYEEALLVFGKTCYLLLIYLNILTDSTSWSSISPFSGHFDAILCHRVAEVSITKTIRCKCRIRLQTVHHGAHFLPMPLTSTTFWRVLMAFSRTGSTDCMIPSLLSMSLIYGCIPSIAFIFLATSTRGCPSSSLFKILAVKAFWIFLMAAVLATAASASPLASLESAELRLDSSETRRSSSFMDSN